MSLIMNETREKAIVFVDYEHWYYSMKNTFQTKPNLRRWRKNIAEKYSIIELLVFADFSKNEIANELSRIREVTNTIIETRNINEYQKKDFTDFIILDHIYQKAITADNIDNFIIFTGDGHFSSVVAFLRYQCNKTVGIYGVRESFSSQLKGMANWYVEIPEDSEIMIDVCQMILQNFYYIEKQRNEKGRVIRPTFHKTVEAVAYRFDVYEETVAEALSFLIDQGYVYWNNEQVALRKTIKVYAVDWNKVDESDIFNMKDVKDMTIPHYIEL